MKKIAALYRKYFQDSYLVITNYEIFPAYSAFFIIPTPIGYGPVCTPIVAPI